MKILHLGVNFRNDQQTQQLFSDLAGGFDSDQKDIKWVVVSNSGNSKQLDSLTQLGVEVMICPQNLGYFGAAAWAWDQLKSSFRGEWVILSNTDLHLDARKFYSQLMNLSSELQNPHQEIGVLAPTIISEISGKDVNPYLIARPSRKKMRWFKFWFSNYFLCQTYQLLAYLKDSLKRAFPSSSSKKGPQEIYAPHGAFIIFHRNYFDRGGNFDHPSFLYGEEIFLAECCRRMGLKVRYEPKLQVFHEDHGSTGLLAYFFGHESFKCRRESSQVLWKLFFEQIGSGAK